MFDPNFSNQPSYKTPLDFEFTNISRNVQNSEAVLDFRDSPPITVSPLYQCELLSDEDELHLEPEDSCHLPHLKLRSSSLPARLEFRNASQNAHCGFDTPEFSALDSNMALSLPARTQA